MGPMRRNSAGTSTPKATQAPSALAPRRLSEFADGPLGRIAFGASAEYDSLLGLAMRVVAAASDIENAQLELLAATAKSDFQLLACIAEPMATPRGRAAAMSAVLRRERPGDARLITRSWKKFDAVIATRNKFAHWHWAVRIGNTDSLVLIEPGARLEMEAGRLAAMAAAASLPQPVMVPVPPLDRTRALVYARELLAALCVEACDAASMASLIVALVEAEPRSGKDYQMIRALLEGMVDEDAYPVNRRQPN